MKIVTISFSWRWRQKTSRKYWLRLKTTCNNLKRLVSITNL